jgi:broad specificity phosphatase PhoE
MSVHATRIHCIRHAEVADAWRGRIYGDLDVPLSERGISQSGAAAQAFDGVPLAAVVSSGLARTEHLARELRRGRALPRRDEPRLREVSRGAWAGLSIAELELRSPGSFAAWLAQPKHRRPPRGESLADAQARTWPALEDLAAEFRGAEIAVVAHLWVLRSILCHVLEIDLERAHCIEVPYVTSCVIDMPESPTRRPVFVGMQMHAAAHGAPDRGAHWSRGPHRA